MFTPLLRSSYQSLSQASSLLLIGFTCYALGWAGWAHGQSSVLSIQGSNTIGAKLAPALVSGLFAQRGFSDIKVEVAGDNQQQVSALDENGQHIRVSIAAHGSGTGFSALEQGLAKLAASSRPIKEAEAKRLASLGDMRSATAEQVIAIDGLAIIVHPSNPIKALSSAQIAAIFAGQISDWRQLGGRPGTINLYARDKNSGTFDTFKELVLNAHNQQLSPSAKRFESSTELSESVFNDPHAIGFIGLPYVRDNQALSVADGDSKPMPPTSALIATEDYPLSRRLYLYNAPQDQHPWLRELVQFAHSPQGQAIVEENGFVAQTVRAITVEPSAEMPEAYRQLANNAQRLSVNFRIQEGSAQLDSKAQRDLRRVLNYLERNNRMYRKAVLVGFGDFKIDPQRAELLSKLRAMAVRRDLARNGVLFREVLGLGQSMPVATNQIDDGRIKNRRVEVWVYN